MQVARYKLPEALPVVDELPLTKIDKKRLRDIVEGKSDAVGGLTSRSRGG